MKSEHNSCGPLERLTKPSGQGALAMTVRLYGKPMQRRHGGFVRCS